MPREFLPLGRKRERASKAELFPRGSARVMAGAPVDRTMHRPMGVERHLVKAQLREMAMGGRTEYPESAE